MKIDVKVNYDSIIKEYLLEQKFSKRFCRKVKLYGKMYVNGVLSPNYTKITKGDVITLEYDEGQNDDIVANYFPLQIEYEDEHILIINKPYDLSSQPSRLHYENNVVSYVKKYFEENNINTNVHLVNRLDYQTSGLMTIAKDGYTHFLLTNDNKIERKYYSLLEGILEEKEGCINLPIKRKCEHEILREVNPLGKEAITLYQVKKETNDKTLVDIKLLTGRTHQIRVHFSYLGHPVIGDKLYGHENERLMLQCYYLKFINPYNGKIIEIIKDCEFNI